MPGGGRRAPPPLPPNGSVDSPPPLPSRHGQGPRTHVVADSVPPPLPSRPGAVVETADDMYEDMNGGFPKIIDARPNKKITSQALLPPSHNSNSNSMQQQNLMMDETYELPILNEQADQRGFPSELEQRNDKPDFDEDMSDDWSESEFDDVGDETQSTDEPDNVDYQMPGCEDPDQVYEEADEAGICNKPVPSPSPKKPSFAPIPVHPATLQMGKMRLNNISQEPSSSKITAASNNKPKLPPKPENTQATSGTSLVRDLAQKLNERAKLKSASVKTDAKEIQSDDSSSAGSTSSQSGVQSHIAAKERRPVVPIHPPKFEGSSIPTNAPLPPKKPARQITVEETDDPDLIYDEAVTESLTLYDWYHGQVDRSVAISRVEKMGENGAFLIRESSKSTSSHRYTLVVLCNGKVHNLVIRQRNDGNLALGQKEKPDEIHFSSLKDLVEHHRANNVRLLKEDELVKLSSTPKRQ